MLKSNPFTLPNFTVKSFIFAFVVLGFCCSLYSSISCQWQEFAGSNDPSNFWSFLPDDKSNVYSIGLFRYQPMAEGGMDQWDVKCQQYSSFFVTETWWFLVPQLFCLFTILAIPIAGGFLVAGFNQKPLAFSLLLACGMQVISLLCSLAWCDNGTWNCPLRVGFVTNFAACICYVLSLVLAVWVIVKTKDDDDDEDKSYESSHAQEAPSKVSLDENPADVSESSTDEETGDRVLFAEDLLGMNDPVATNNVRQYALAVDEVKSLFLKKGPCPDENDSNYFAKDEASKDS